MQAHNLSKSYGIATLKIDKDRAMSLYMKALNSSH